MHKLCVLKYGSFSIDINNYPDDPLMPELEDIAAIHSTGIFGSAYDDLDSYNTPIANHNVGAEANFNNMEPSIVVSPIPTTKIHSIHSKEQIIGDPKSAVQTRRMAKKSEAGLISFINKQRRTNHKDFQNCLFACFLSQVEPKKGHRQEEGIDYDEVFAPVARIEAIRLFLAYASYINFTVYQMDVKSAFLYGTIEEEVYVNQSPGFVDPEFPNKVYKVANALYGLHQAPRAWYETLSTYLLENGFRRGTIDKTLFMKKIKNDILLVQVYVDDIIFGSTKKSLSTEFEQLMRKRFQMSSMGELTFFLASTPMETYKSLSTNAAEPDVDVYLYRSMIGSLMYLTSSRPDIMFALCACSRFQVTPKASHMHAVKRIFRYLKGKPTLDLWYPKDSPMDLIAYSDSDYAGADIDIKSTTRDCQFLSCRFEFLIASIVDTAGYHFVLLVQKLILLGSVSTAVYIWIGVNARTLASPKQTTFGKDFPNPLMAGSLPKTIKQSNDLPLSRGYTLRSGEDNLKLMELMVNCTKLSALMRKKNREICTTEDGIQAISATIDGHDKTITEASLRRHLKLEDVEGISSLSNEEIFEHWLI
ncbi:putative ribonuclease H-like domain-containing protein [Tanacetum coccineum]|uniref:Ribonuclease H-like domain-containing protein n=1 Tax=Tanacetum coccineum TaxID=301880 RepID=A0ABQ5A135_9ASTR